MNVDSFPMEILIYDCHPDQVIDMLNSEMQAAHYNLHRITVAEAWLKVEMPKQGFWVVVKNGVMHLCSKRSYPTWERAIKATARY